MPNRNFILRPSLYFISMYWIIILITFNQRKFSKLILQASKWNKNIPNIFLQKKTKLAIEDIFTNTNWKINITFLTFNILSFVTEHFISSMSVEHKKAVRGHFLSTLDHFKQGLFCEEKNGQQCKNIKAVQVQVAFQCFKSVNMNEWNKEWFSWVVLL